MKNATFGKIYNMKNLLLLAFAIMPILSKAQITLEHTFTGTNSPQPILFTSNGEKIIASDTGTNIVKLYNIDYSLWKSISVPSYLDYKFSGASVVSDNLFNSDNNIEFVASYSKYDGSTYPYGFYHSAIIDERGAIIQDLGNAYLGAVHFVNGAYKLYTQTIYDYVYKVYSLPGTIPCGKCGGLGSESVDHTPTSTGMSAYPNPSGGMAVITYDLPNGTSNALITVYNSNGQVAKVYNVNSNSRELIINGNDLTPGMYSYSLSGDGIAPVTKKLVIY